MSYAYFDAAKCMGLELTTSWLQSESSTTVLPRLFEVHNSGGNSYYICTSGNISNEKNEHLLQIYIML
jgi:hypothetical protein